MKTKLTASNAYEQVVLDYIESLDAPELIEKINAGDKGLSDCMSYVKSQAKSKAVNGCAILTDQEVFGMAVHYFEEDSIKKGATPSVKAELKQIKKPKTEKPKAPVIAKSNDIEGQMSFSF